MAVTRPTVGEDVTHAASAVELAAAIETICGYIDTNVTAIAARASQSAYAQTKADLVTVLTAMRNSGALDSSGVAGRIDGAIAALS